MRQFDTVIVSGGSIQDEFALDFFKREMQSESGKSNEVRWIAADKGLEFFARNGLVPHLVVGDFDSASPKMEQYLSVHPEIEVVRLCPQKDDSDTQSALRMAAQQGAKEVLLLGCLGTRMDHMVANLGLLLMAKSLGISVTIMDAWNRIRLVSSGTVLERAEQFGRYVSFFALGGPVEGLCLSGFQYPLDHHCLRMEEAGLTVSNEFSEERASIFYDTGNLMMIESRD